MNLKKLEAFTMVVEKSSFSEAAAVLKSSQPSISLKIKSLEEELGMDLLERSTAGLKPTQAGTLVYHAAKDVLQRWNKCVDELSVYEGTLTGHLTIGASTIPGTYLLPKWIRKFRDLYPGVDVRVEIGDSRKMLEALVNHQIDAAIIGLQADLPQVEFVPVSSDSLVLITPNEHPLLEKKNVEMSELARYEFVLRESGSGTRKRMENYLALHGMSEDRLKVALSTGSTEAVIASVEAGIGISLISKLAALPAANAKRIRIWEGFEPINREFYFSTLREPAQRLITKEFAKVISERLLF